jgi:ABC-2 type transport system permease protein
MQLLSVLKKDLKLLLRDRGGLAALFLMPLAFILPISFALGSGDGYDLNQDAGEQLPVINYDGGAHARELVNTLESSFQVENDFTAEQAEQAGVGDAAECAQAGPTCDEKIATNLVERSARTAALIIPPGFSAAIDAGQHITLTMLYDPVADAADRQLFEGVIEGAALQLSIENQISQGTGQFDSMLTFAPEEFRESIEEQQEAADTEEEQEPALSLVKVKPSNFTLLQIPDTYQQTVPGYTVMFVFFIIVYLSGTIQVERHNGTFRRLLGMPVARHNLLGGKLLTSLIIGLAQVAILFGIGVFAFGMNLGQDLLALFLLTVSLVAAATAIGLAAATTNAENVLTAPLIVGALLGGCMFPVDLMPQFLRAVSYVVPHSWAMTGYQDLMVRGQGLLQVLPQIGVLLAFAVVFFVIAVRRFDYEA